MRKESVDPSRHFGRGRSRGQALVEFALVAPIFFLIFFSVAESALIVASIGSYNFAARDAARLGSILGRQSTTTVVDGKIVRDVQAHVQGVAMAKAQEVDIYRAAADGLCLTAATGSASETSVDSSTCIKNQYSLDGSLIAGTSVQWTTDQRDDSLESADYLGVRVVYRYTYITGFIAAFGSTLNLSATSVQRIEPQEFTGFHGGIAASSLLSVAQDLSVPPRMPLLLGTFARIPDVVGWLPMPRGWTVEQP